MSPLLQMSNIIIAFEITRYHFILSAHRIISYQLSFLNFNKFVVSYLDNYKSSDNASFVSHEFEANDNS